MTELSIADRIALGLTAGFVGALVMTLSQKGEQALDKRPDSIAPAEAVEKLSGVALATKSDEQKASLPIHLAYGSALGAAYGLADAVKEPWRALAMLVGSWAGGQALLTALGLQKPPTEQKPAELAVDVGHHVIYAAATGAAYAGLRGLAAR